MGFASVQYVCTSLPHPGTSQVSTFQGLHASAAVDRPQTTHSSFPFGIGVAARAYDGMNPHGPGDGKWVLVEMGGSDENYAALREAVFLAQAEELRATNDRAKGATRGGRRVVIVKGDADQHALQDVVG